MKRKGIETLGNRVKAAYADKTTSASTARTRLERPTLVCTRICDGVRYRTPSEGQPHEVTSVVHPGSTPTARTSLRQTDCNNFAFL